MVEISPGINSFLQPHPGIEDMVNQPHPWPVGVSTLGRPKNQRELRVLTLRWSRIEPKMEKVSGTFAQLLSGLETGHPVTVGQSPEHASHTEQSETVTRKTAFCLSETLKSYARDWPTITGCPIYNPGNNCANGLLDPESKNRNFTAKQGFSEIKKLLDRQVGPNFAPSFEGLRNPWFFHAMYGKELMIADTLGETCRL